LYFGLATLAMQRLRREPPVFAADGAGVSLRLGIRPATRYVRLGWDEVAAVRTTTWRAPLGTAVPVLCLDAPAVQPRLLQEPGFGHLDRQVRLFGTPFVVIGRDKDVTADVLIATVRRMAAAAGVVEAR